MLFGRQGGGIQRKQRRFQVEENPADGGLGGTYPGPAPAPTIQPAAGQQSTGSQVSGRQSPYEPMPQTERPWQMDADRARLNNMVPPTEPNPGKLSTVLSVLSDIFLNKDIPGGLRQAKFGRQMARFNAERAPLVAKVAQNDSVYQNQSSQRDQAEKEREFAYTANKPPAGDYYTGVGKKTGLPTRVHYDPTMTEPLELSTEYETPQREPQRASVPGTDEPLSPDVEAQRIRIAGAEADARRAPSTADDKRKIQLSNQLTAEFKALEAKHRSDVDSFQKKYVRDPATGNYRDAGSLTGGGDGLTADEYQAAIERLQQEHADAKQRVHEHYASLAAGEGIDLGTPPDYQGQLRGARKPAPRQQTTKPGLTPGAEQYLQSRGLRGGM